MTSRKEVLFVCFTFQFFDEAQTVEASMTVAQKVFAGNNLEKKFFFCDFVETNNDIFHCVCIRSSFLLVIGYWLPINFLFADDGLLVNNFA